MNLQEINYDAFISYRHCELDQFVAVTLHKELEAFKLPKTIRKQLQEKGVEKKKIERVFRDRDELPITNNLADPITNALRNSEFLLVICSPRLKESLWCRKEIETFINMHGREKVFAVLIEGEPADSFPDELLYVEKRITDENGIEQVMKEPVEPLAADVRGKNKTEIRKKIKEEVLRLAAPMFDCSYDDLKQRHKERMIKRIIAIAGTVSAFFGVFGVVSSVMAYQINQQSVQIRQQSQQIQEQSDEINKQYREALITNAKQLSEDTFSLIEKGDLDLAIDTAYYALTGNISEGAKGMVAENEIADMPYTADAEYALSSALNLYRNGMQIAPVRLLKQESQISFTHTSPDMTKLMVVDIFGNLSIFDPISGDTLYQTFLDRTYMSEDEACFLNNTEIVYPLEKGIAVYNLESKEERKVGSESVALIQTDKNGKYICTMRYDGLTVYDNGLSTVFALGDEGLNFSYQVSFSKEGGDIVVVEIENEEQLAGVCLVNLKTGERTNFITDSESITSMWVEDEYAYLTAYSGSDLTEGMIYCITTDGSFVWKTEVSGMPDHIMAFGTNGNDKLVFEVYSKLYVLNKKDGSLLCETDCGREIVNYASYAESDTITYMSREGEYHYYMTDSNNDMVIMDKFLTNSDNLKEFMYGNGYYASVAYQDNSVAVYKTILGRDVESLLDMEETPLKMVLSRDEKYAVCRVNDVNYQCVYVVDLEKKKIVHKITTDSHVRDIAVTKDNEIMVLHTDMIEGYDLLSGEQIFRRETETSNEYFLRDGEVYVGDDFSVFYMCDSKSGEILYTMEDNHVLQDGMLTSDIESSGTWYAYASENYKGIVLGTFEDGDKHTLGVNGNEINAISIAMQEQVVYLTYLDETVEVYDINTGDFVRSYDNVPGGVSEVLELPEINQTLLLTTGNAYLLNAEKEVIAFIESFECYKCKEDAFLLSKYGEIFQVPRYDVEDLKELVE